MEACTATAAAITTTTKTTQIYSIMTNEFYPSPTTRFLLPNRAEKLSSWLSTHQNKPLEEIKFYHNTSPRPLLRFICKPCSFPPLPRQWTFNALNLRLFFANSAPSLPKRKKEKRKPSHVHLWPTKNPQTLLRYIIFLPTATNPLILFPSLVTIIFGLLVDRATNLGLAWLFQEGREGKTNTCVMFVSKLFNFLEGGEW